MSTTIYPGFQQYWNCSGAPSSTLVLGQGGVLYVNDTVIDTDTNNFYVVTNNGTFDSDTQTYTGVTYQTAISSSNIGVYSPTASWNINSNRNYSSASLAFSASRTPNSELDTVVTAVFSHTSTLLTSALVEIQVKTSDSWVTVGQSGLSGLAATTTNSVTFIVPSNSQYQFVSSSGTNSIVSIYELSQ